MVFKVGLRASTFLIVSISHHPNGFPPVFLTESSAVRPPVFLMVVDFQGNIYIYMINTYTYIYICKCIFTDTTPGRQFFSWFRSVPIVEEWHCRLWGLQQIASREVCMTCVSSKKKKQGFCFYTPRIYMVRIWSIYMDGCSVLVGNLR